MREGDGDNIEKEKGERNWRGREPNKKIKKEREEGGGWSNSRNEIKKLGKMLVN